jgi:ATP:ADP antiporter, AAA family
MLVSAFVLVLSAALTQVTARREQGRRAAAVDPARRAPSRPAADDQSGTFALVFRHKYLLLIAGFSLLFTLVNTNGEYMLGEIVSGEAKTLGLAGNAKRDFIASFYGDFFLFVNVAVLVLQTFFVSRIVRWGGLRLAFFVLPTIALLDSIGVALSPVLGIIRVAKIAENATDYSVNNTVRNMLWLPTTTEMKYKAKQAVDTFFVRMGDVGSAVLVGVGVGALGLPIRAFAVVNLVLVAGWLFLARGIIRENARLAGRGSGEA